MNNQFSGPNAWDDYLTALEHATPVIEAIAVTDYYVTDTYEEVLRHKAAGRLPSTKLVFPNVELRLDVATAKGSFVNLHLFVSPEDPQHLDELRRPVIAPTVQRHARSFRLHAGRSHPAWQEGRSQHSGRARRAGLWGQPVQGQFPEAPRGVLRKRMGEDEHPDRGGRRRDRRHIGRAGGCRSNDPARDRGLRPCDLRRQSGAA